MPDQAQERLLNQLLRHRGGRTHPEKPAVEARGKNDEHHVEGARVQPAKGVERDRGFRFVERRPPARYAGATGFATDLMVVCTQVPNHPEWLESTPLGMIVLRGLGEALSPMVFAGGFLLAQGLLVALGLKRLAG